MDRWVARISFVFGVVLGAGQCFGAEGTVVRETVHSAAVAENMLGDPGEQEVIIYLPPSYESGDGSTQPSTA